MEPLAVDTARRGRVSFHKGRSLWSVNHAAGDGPTPKWVWAAHTGLSTKDRKGAVESNEEEIEVDLGEYGRGIGSK